MPPTPPSEPAAVNEPTFSASPTATTPATAGTPAGGSLADDHPLSARARGYGEWVIRGETWPLSAVDLEKITWATSTRARRRHGRCGYGGDGRVTITLSERTADRAGFTACQTTIRHELVHAWQYQHRGKRAVATDHGVVVSGVTGTHTGRDTADASTHDVDTDETDTNDVSMAAVDGSKPVATNAVSIETGHGESFQVWVDLLDLPGRCANYYDRNQSDFAYVYGCPACGDWWGRHRLCPSVRQAAHGTVGSTGYRYCTDCDVLVQLRAGSWYLAHGDHDDETIRRFADGEWESTAANAEVSLIAVDEETATPRPE